MHPNLDFDLLGAQIEACHEIGVKYPIYFTVGWSVYDAEIHPEWVNKNPDGSLMVSNQTAYDFNASLNVTQNIKKAYLIPIITH